LFDCLTVLASAGRLRFVAGKLRHRWQIQREDLLLQIDRQQGRLRQRPAALSASGQALVTPAHSCFDPGCQGLWKNSAWALAGREVEHIPHFVSRATAGEHFLCAFGILLRTFVAMAP